MHSRPKIHTTTCALRVKPRLGGLGHRSQLGQLDASNLSDSDAKSGDEQVVVLPHVPDLVGIKTSKSITSTHEARPPAFLGVFDVLERDFTRQVGLIAASFREMVLRQ